MYCICILIQPLAATWNKANLSINQLVVVVVPNSFFYTVCHKYCCRIESNLGNFSCKFSLKMKSRFFGPPCRKWWRTTTWCDIWTRARRWVTRRQSAPTKRERSPPTVWPSFRATSAVRWRRCSRRLVFVWCTPWLKKLDWESWW